MSAAKFLSQLDQSTELGGFWASLLLMFDQACVWCYQVLETNVVKSSGIIPMRIQKDFGHIVK
jgi:hypothetical protein